MFTIGREHTRDETRAQLGGTTVSRLPTSNAVMVAACLGKRISPRAPAVVMCGQGKRTGPVRTLFSRQRTAVPVFIKNASKMQMLHCWLRTFIGQRVTRSAA